jgi:pSer/pThr/pTyr-binding forkhead associated (FHA) protein
MELTFGVLLWMVRIAFLLLIYIFLIRAFGMLHRSLATESFEGRPVGTLIVERSPARTPRVGERLRLRATNAIGRDAGNDIALPDEAASARHATLALDGGEWWIEDLGSTNGTLVNGVRIAKRERLHPGDEIGIGRVALRLER